LRTFVTPKVVISKCIEFEPCRYNAQIIASDFVKMLKPHVEFLPVCPESEIGLGVPRDAIRLVALQETTRLMQPKTGRDVTKEMKSFAQDFLSSLGGIDGFILKASSPTCGIRNTKIYPGIEKVAPISRTATGLFGDAVIERFSRFAIEDEGRLRNARIKEHFLKRLFTLARFRELKATPSMKNLINFHKENKFLLMSYNQAEMKVMGNIAANSDQKPISELIKDYEAHLLKALSRAPRYTSNINVLMHALGHFSDRLNDGEKAMFLDMLQRYREGKVTICPATTLLKAWIVRFDEEYLRTQTFFEPYPQDLMEIDPISSHKGRDLW